MAMLPATLSACLAAALLAGCVAPSTRMTKPEEFADTDMHSHTFAGSTAMACEAARRALLSQGYVISENKETLVRGLKNFQPDSDIHVQIEFNVVCAADGKGSNSTTTFANAVRDRYSLKKSSTSASVGVSVLGSLSLPFGFNDDAMVKVASETIDSKRFYEQFFTLVERYFDDTTTVPDTDAPEPIANASKPVAAAGQAVLPAPAASAVSSAVSTPASSLTASPVPAIVAPQLAPIVSPAAVPAAVAPSAATGNGAATGNAAPASGATMSTAAPAAASPSTPPTVAPAAAAPAAASPSATPTAPATAPAITPASAPAAPAEPAPQPAPSTASPVMGQGG
ncbi:MAG: DUF2242 domain-containing protein [Janthinobacterium lividum]